MHSNNTLAKKLDGFKPIRLVLVFVLILYILIIEAINIKAPEKYFITSDFVTYLTAAKMIKEGKTNGLYDLNQQFAAKSNLLDRKPEFFSLFLNTPITAIPYIPLLEFDLRNAFNFYTIVTLATTLITLILLQKEFKIEDRYLISLIAFMPIFVNLSYGQITPYIFLFLVASYIKLKNKNYLYAGIIAGLTCLKPQYLIILPFLTVIQSGRQEKLRFITGALITITIWFILNILVYGVQFPADYIEFLSYRPKDLIFKEHEASYNLFSFKVFSPETKSLGNFLAIATAFLYFVSLYILSINKGKTLELLFSLAIIFSLIYSYHVHIPDLLFLVFPIFALLKKGQNENNNKLLQYMSVLVIFAIPILGEFFALYWLGMIILLTISYSLAYS